MNRRCLNCMHIFQVPDDKQDMNYQCPTCGFIENTPPEEETSLKPGTILKDRYVIGTVIGVGGFGITYRTWDQVLESMVCVKEFFPQGLAVRTQEATVSALTSKGTDSFEHGRSRFLKEARSLAKFNADPGTVTIHDFFEENGTAYIVMEYLEGCNMKEYAKQNGGIIPYDMLIKMADSVCDVLEKVHSVGLIHRDISPDNIFFCKNGLFKLIDFGAVKQSAFGDGHSATVILKHGYAPIEQYSQSGNVGPWTDIYSVGATLYKLASGIKPPEAVNRVTEDTLVPLDQVNPSLPKSFSRAVMRALAVQVGDRLQSVTDFKQALHSEGETAQETVALDPDSPEYIQMNQQLQQNQMNQPSFIPQQPAYSYDNNQAYNSASSYTNGPGEKSEKSGKKMNILIAVLGVLLVGMIVAIVILLRGKGDNDKVSEATESVTEAETEAVDDTDTSTEAETEAVDDTDTLAETTTEATTELTTEATTEATTTASAADDNEYRERFGIDASSVENYDQNLNPDEYIYYDSGIGDFKFSYPAKLFNDIKFDDSSSTTVYGENVQTVDLTGSDGAEFIYSVYRRTDGKSISDFTDQINDYEHGSNYNLSDIVVGADDDHGRIVLAGTMDAAGEKMIYDLVTIKGDYIYRMACITRAYANEDERIKCSYITENAYRMCGFSGSTDQPRSYEEFAAGQ